MKSESDRPALLAPWVFGTWAAAAAGLLLHLRTVALGLDVERSGLYLIAMASLGAATLVFVGRTLTRRYYRRLDGR